MSRRSRDAAEADLPDHSHALVRKILLEIGRRQGARDARACGELFALIERVLSIRRHLLAKLAARGVSEVKFCALTVLVGSESAASTPSELAHHAGVTRATMTEVLDQMVEAGWISRSRSAGDRRQWVVRLTPAGREIADGAIATLLAAATKLVEKSGSRVVRVKKARGGKPNDQTKE